MANVTYLGVGEARSHRYFIEGANMKFKGEAELNGTFEQSDESQSQGQSTTQTAAITTFLQAAGTLSDALGELGDVKLIIKSTGDEGKVSV